MDSWFKMRFKVVWSRGMVLLQTVGLWALGFSLKILSTLWQQDSTARETRSTKSFGVLDLSLLLQACHGLPGCQGAVLYEIVALRRPFEVLVRVSELSTLYWTTWVGISLHIMSAACCGVSVWLKILEASNQLALVRKICEERLEIW